MRQIPAVNPFADYYLHVHKLLGIGATFEHGSDLVISHEPITFPINEEEELERFYGRIGQYHIPFWENEIKDRVVFFPGSVKRAEKIKKYFSDTIEHGAERGIVGYTGNIDNIPVCTIASGMGSGQVEIMMFELLRAGAGAVIRYGSQGALKPFVRTGDLLLAEYAIPADSSFAHMTDEQMKQRHLPRITPELLQPMITALEESGYIHGNEEKNDTQRFYVGGIHSKGLLYAQEIGIGPRSGEYEVIKKMLEKRPGVIGSEMETSLMYTIAERLNYLLERHDQANKRVMVGSINFFIGDFEHPFHPDENVRRMAEEKMLSTVPNVARHAYEAVRNARRL